MSDNRDSNAVLINKYPNRRYYDTLDSRHVTLQEIHDLIVAGKDVRVTDTRTGDDVTNLVLMQILLERDQPKLDLFPSAIMHMMIRSNRKVLRSMFDRFFGPFLDFVATGQKQWDSYLRESMKSPMLSPLDWGGMFRGFAPDSTSRSAQPATPPRPDDQDEKDQIEELRSEMELLRRKIADLDTGRPSKSRKKRKTGQNNRRA